HYFPTTGKMDMNPVTAFVLGDIAGGIRITQEIAKAAVGAGNRHQSDADTNTKKLVFPMETKVLHTLTHAFRGTDRLLDFCILQQDAEFIPAEACNRIVFPNLIRQLDRDLAQ